MPSILRRVLLTGVFAVAVLAAWHPLVRAATVPAGFQEYVVLGHEQQIWDIYNRIVATDPLGGFQLENAMSSVVSITASSDNQIIIYDQWEDGFEADLFAPAQSTTLILGDSVDANGRACDYVTSNPCDGIDDDLLREGDNLSLNSDQGIGAAPPPACGGPLVLNGCVPVNAANFGTGGPGGTGGRDPAYVRFDGGDRILSSGGPVFLVHLQEPAASFGGATINNVLGGAVEMISKEAVAGATSYTVPVGEDTFTNLGGINTPGEPFQTVSLNIVAFEDGTSVVISSPGAGTVSFTLNAGEHYSTLGMIDGASAMPSGVAAPAITVNEGTRIATSKPLTGMIIAGGDGTYASRTYAILPDILHSNDYVVTAPGDAGGNNPANLYIFNPDQLNDITVTITDVNEARQVTVPAGTAVSYGELQVRDEFTAPASYANNDGSDDWATNWIEFDAADGTQSPTAGNVFISNGELWLRDSPNTNTDPDIVREVDLSNYDRATLSFDFRTNPATGHENTDDVVVEISSNGGTTYTQLERFQNDQAPSSRSYNITSFASANTRIRFRVDTGFGAADEAFLVDNVEIRASKFLPPDSTARLTSDRKFWGITAYDHQGTGFDWGHSWLATEFLTDTYTAPRAPTPGDSAAVYISATEDATCVRIDLDNDGTLDNVDDGTGTSVPFAGTATCADGYVVNALQSLLLIDPDGDATGARITADKPVALAYGLETDTTGGGAASLDLGYAIYPVLQLFLDPVMTVDKSGDVSAVSTAGGTVRYTVQVDAYRFGPLSGLEVKDLLPAGIVSGDYVPDSTVITRPDLSTLTGAAANPSSSIDPATGRTQLDWTAVLLADGLDVLQSNERITVEYELAVPAGLSGVLTNEARAEATLGTSSVFSPTDTHDVVVTDVILDKTVSDDGSPAAGEVLNYTLEVQNTGTNETAVVITDPIPANTTFCDDITDPGVCAAIGTAGPFTGTYVPAQNAVIWTAPVLPGAATTFQLSFDVRVNPAAPAGTAVSNTATFQSTNVPAFDSNTVTSTLVGPSLEVDKLAVGAPSPVHPGQTITYDVTASNVGAGSATNVLISDLIQPGGTYVASSLQWRLNAGAFQPLTDASDGVEASGADGRFTGSRAELRLATLGPGQDLTFRFQVQVTGSDGDNLSNQATVSADQVAPGIDSPLVQIPIDGDATVTGRIFVDTDDDGIQDPGEIGIGDVDVRVTDELGNTQIVVTDASGDFTVVVPANIGGATTLEVITTDPDFPPDHALCTAPLPLCDDPQTVTAVAGATVAATAVGYVPQALSITKTSDAPATGVVPGQTLTYSVTVQNTGGTGQTGVDITDVLPPGVTSVPGTTMTTGSSGFTADPPALLTGASLAAGETVTVTFQVTVDSPVPPGITDLTNTSTADSDQVEPVQDTVTDGYQAGVRIEPNGAGTVIDTGMDATIEFLHTITNTGISPDSFQLAVFSDAGFSIELVDPATGTVIATDPAGDGTWGGNPPPNTGTLVRDGDTSYIVRVTVPTATAGIGSSDRVELRATSDTAPATSASAFDEIRVVDGGIDGSGDVIVEPDNARSAAPGAVVAYTHTVTYRQGSVNDPDPLNPPPRAFQLQANTSLSGWTATVFQDSNGDGVFTPGVDVAITSTATLAAGGSQRVFVVVDVPPGAVAGDVAVTTLTASFYDPGALADDISDDVSLGGSATDTTTVSDGTVNALGFDLSGGGTRIVGPGETAVYPGELGNTGNAADRYDFAISASPYADGLEPPPDSNQPDDGLPHPTELVLDTDGDGDIDASDAVVAVDTDGDGVWDMLDVNGDGVFDPPGSIGPFNTDGDTNPDVAVAAGAFMLFELRRDVDVSQGPYADSVFLRVTSQGSGRSGSVTATTSLQAATLAVIDALVAYDTPQGVVVEWRTASEHGTVGFTLERRDPRRARWQRVSTRLLPALLHSRHGAIYRLLDRRARPGEVAVYRLIELEATGATLEHGPFWVVVGEHGPIHPDAGSADRPLPGYERIARSIDTLSTERARRKAAARHAAALRRALRRSPVVKVLVRESGMTRLDADPIAKAMGLTPEAVEDLIRRNRLALHHAGEQVATHAPDVHALLFYGEAADSLYTRDNVYHLSVGRGLAMKTVNARRPRAVANQTHRYTAHAEGNRYHLTHLFDDPDDDYWMWDFRFEDMRFDSNEDAFILPTPGVAGAGSATLTVRLHGGLEAVHRARITLDGAVERVFETEWEGLTPHVLRVAIDGADLVDGENRVRIDGLGSGDPARPSTFYINDLEVTYDRRNEAAQGRLVVSHEPRNVLTMSGFADVPVMVFDVTSPRFPRVMKRVTRELTPSGIQLSVAPRERAIRQVLAVETPALRAPHALVADAPSVLSRRDHRVDWLLITSSDMLDAARTLAQHREAQGLRTLVVDIEDVYDEFAHGLRDPEAIWALLRHAHTRWRVAPRYVVLAGEGSFDYKDYLGHGDSIIPTLLAPTGEGLFPSDNLFADVQGDDFLPEMAIGRLPVVDARELEAVVRKIIAYEAASGDWTGKAVFATDPADDGGDFQASSELVRAQIPPGAVRIDALDLDPDNLPASVARALLHERLNQGRAFFNFFGHASSGSLGNLAPGLINARDLLSPESSLANGDTLPVVTAFTCLVGQFGFPGSDGISELLLLAPDRGAAAVFSPSGLSRNALARHLGVGFYEATYGRGERVIGEAILHAQRHYARTGSDLPLLDIYNLLGDPATVMK